MPILFLALVALAVFGAIGLMLCVACFSEHRVQRAKLTAAGAPLAAEPPNPSQSRSAVAGHS